MDGWKFQVECVSHVSSQLLIEFGSLRLVFIHSFKSGSFGSADFHHHHHHHHHNHLNHSLVSQITRLLFYCNQEVSMDIVL